jgi:phosphate uptake regulator
VRELLATPLVELEHHLEDGLERAAAILPQIAEAIQVPNPDKVQKIAGEAGRLRRAGRTVDSELVIVTARQAPVASDLQFVLALIEVAHHSVLIANQFHLITEQLISVDPAAIDRGGTAVQLAAMTHLAGSQLCHAVRAFRSRDLAVALRIDVTMSRMTRSTSSNREVFEAALALEDAPEEHERALRHVLIARSIERIADNAVVTAERSEFTDASLPRHRTL